MSKAVAAIVVAAILLPLILISVARWLGRRGESKPEVAPESLAA